MRKRRKPRLAVLKFASCDGCQLTLLDCEDELLAIAGAVEIAYFAEARRQMLPGPYDVCLVEGSITTEEEIQRIKEARRQSRFLVSIGACAVAGGIQALRNWTDVNDYIDVVYARPDYVSTLERSRPVADFVPVDFELRGCPISKGQLLELVTSLLIGRKPRVPAHSVCLECKREGTVCVMVAQGIHCLGPATQAGCEAVCPAYGRGCYGCFGPAETVNTQALGERFLALGQSRGEVSRAFRGFNGYSPAFREASEQFVED
jgi:coenzyme F420-reducing hydrogenase gamma subunit